MPRSRSRSRSPPPRYRDSRRRSRSPDFDAERQRSRAAYDASTSRSGGASSSRGAPGRPGAGDEPDAAPAEAARIEPDFAPSGLLAAASNSKNGTALKYHEPPEARAPKRKWRCYVYKGKQELEMLHLRASCLLFGRDVAVADVPITHPSCSKQHAVFQFRRVSKVNEYGEEKHEIKPFLLDLDSANGTLLNGEEIEARRYVELLTGDTVRFGTSERDYVLLREE